MIYQILVKPGSKQESIEKLADGTLVVRTHKPAHDGEANKDLIRLLSKYFQTAKGNINIIKGQKSKHKTIDIS